ncbi:MAG TPA: 16S rRNA (uracil(1498)-N(3))-methyltransferase [Bacteroidia bacterium]|nr:16S rRNA (uracil(1498)-N(3))-methyltransferase [Bacteroidia bacterium]
MNIFYCPIITTDQVTLDEAESQHAVKVLRLVAGDRIILFDGQGGKYEGEIDQPHHKKCVVKITKKENTPKRPFHLHIAIAPTKMNDRMEWFLEKVTEIGIDEITPVICERSERKVTNHDRFEKVLIAAMKQSMNPWLPVLNDQVDLKLFLEKSPPGFIAHCMETKKTPLKKCDLHQEKITILIGPEGDFTEGEVVMASDKGWMPVSLGESRLRTETAGIVACHTVNLLKE